MAESTGEVVRQRNREVPFPTEINAKRGELEDYFASLVGKEVDDIYHYDDLPQTFSSIGMDQYSAWLADLTAADPEHRERAAFVYLREYPLKFIYLPNPAIGTEQNSEPVLTHNPQTFVPLTRAHSHLDTTCFSPQDLGRVIAEEGTWYEENDFFSEIVGTPKQNFLLLKTADTTFEDPENVNRILNEFKEQAQKMRKDIDDSVRASMGDAVTKEAADLLLLCHYQAEKEVFGADYANYFTTIAATHEIAKAHKIGFFVSDRNGLYRQVKDTDLQAIQEKRKVAEKIANRAFAVSSIAAQIVQPK